MPYLGLCSCLWTKIETLLLLMHHKQVLIVCGLDTTKDHENG